MRRNHNVRFGNTLAGQYVFIHDDINPMTTTAALLLCLFQASGPVPPGADRLTFDSEWCAHDAASPAQGRQRAERYEEQEFVLRVKGLAAALMDFSKTYNSGRVIDVKNIKALRKAMRELEKSEWFSRKGE
jgi:hypothetical protein